MNKKIAILLSSTALLILPFIVFAVPPSNLTLGGVANGFLSIIATFIWPLFIGFAIIMFIIAGVHFLNNDPAKGRTALLWGVVGVAVGVLAFSLPFMVAHLLGANI